MAHASRTTWFHRPLPRPGARLRLVCVPYAGGGTAVFRDWPARLPADIEVVAVRLPGRESRLAEPPHTRWPALTAALAQALADEIAPPYALFGHSMGGMLAYELVRLLAGTPAPRRAAEGRARRGPLPERLILAGCRAPDVPRPLPAVHDLPDPRFHEEVRRLAGTPREILDSPALLSLVTPMLRADLRLAETWPPAAGTWPLPVPLTTFDATDDPMAPPAAVAAWRRHAPHGVRAHHLPGGHFFLRESAGLLLRLLGEELTERGPAACDPLTSPRNTSGSAPMCGPS